jgi:cell wall-associated NlpC family hydrolase
MNKRQQLVNYLWNFIGSAYTWGAFGPYDTGYDCSGLVQEGLCSIGLWGKEDTTAQGMYDYFFKHGGKQVIKPSINVGDLLFFGKSERQITHITVAINGYQMIEAGGGSQTIKGGMVRVRPIAWRSDFVAALNVVKD